MPSVLSSKSGGTSLDSAPKEILTFFKALGPHVKIGSTCGLEKRQSIACIAKYSSKCKAYDALPDVWKPLEIIRKVLDVDISNGVPNCASYS
ncbi:hypothetical protein TNCV_1331381 [Trichonephila clavipes]|nr:hypothetical protein TNCV_1331381 [Trichonephila clavipes]